MVETISAGAFLLLLALLRLDFFVAALRELARLLEAPLGTKFGARRGLGVDEAEGGVVVGGCGEGVVVREVKDGVRRVLGAGRVVEVASPVGDAAQFVGAGEGGEGDVQREVDVAAGGGAVRRTPPLGVERNGSDVECFSHWRNARW